mmetsp:Transcript_58094/g.136163  ORF Transcript_58094/g.136163 Transcript_58094/m.136163 type:complete len:82 (-) Transcript_58094:1335-1580(-)
MSDSITKWNILQREPASPAPSTGLSLHGVRKLNSPRRTVLNAASLSGLSFATLPPAVQLANQLAKQTVKPFFLAGLDVSYL